MSRDTHFPEERKEALGAKGTKVQAAKGHLHGNLNLTSTSSLVFSTCILRYYKFIILPWTVTLRPSLFNHAKISFGLRILVTIVNSSFLFFHHLILILRQTSGSNIMRILNWVQSKISGKPGVVYSTTAVRHHTPDTRKEEFSDWPHGLLAIGTFGTNNLKGDSQKESISAISYSSQDQNDLTAEEVDKLQKELEDFLNRHEKSDSSKDETDMKSKKKSLPSDKSQTGSLNLDVKACGDLNLIDVRSLSPNSRVILNREKDILAENHIAVNQRSVSFLFKKMFSCRSGFPPTPSLRDPLQASIMEKLLKAILHKKIHPQNTSPALTRKYLEKKPSDVKGSDDKTPAKPNDGSKWVKTDSEYIVLEI